MINNQYNLRSVDPQKGTVCLKTLFDKTIINKMEIKNRFVRSATWENMADENGHFTDRLFGLYEDLAKGGIGLIITSVTYISKNSKSLSGQIGFYGDEFIEEYKKLASIVHKYGSKIVLQINYGSKDGQRLIPTDVTVEDIKRIVALFGDAAVRAEKAGIDGVQIHSAHGFFLSQFLSLIDNKRTDFYGGNLENNTRFLLEIYDEIRKRTGKEFTTFVKINCIDANESENAFKACEYACSQLSNRGIDGIEISGGNDTGQYKESIYRDYAAEIASKVSVPVILVGKNRTPEIMEKILNGTAIEYFSMSRSLICQPDLVKLWENDLKQKSECISCGKCRGENGISCVLSARRI